VLEPVGGQYRVVQAHADDDGQLDRHHRHQADHTGPDKGQANQPHGPHRAHRTEHSLLTVAGHDPAGQPGPDESADAGGGEGEAVLPGRESELAQQEHGQQRLGRHDQPADQQVIEVERAQAPMGQDVPPAVEQLAATDPALIAALGTCFLAALNAILAAATTAETASNCTKLRRPKA
jgi:hypothetical protein